MVMIFKLLDMHRCNSMKFCLTTRNPEGTLNFLDFIYKINLNDISLVFAFELYLNTYNIVKNKFNTNV